MFIRFSPDARINPVIFEKSNLPPSQFLKFLEKGIHKILGAYFDDVWVEFDKGRTRASARGTFSVFRSGGWKTRTSAELAFYFRRRDNGWEVVLLDGKPL